jgi:hypothetical protein
MPCPPILFLLRSTLILSDLLLGFKSGLFPLGFPTKIHYALFLSVIRATYPTNRILLNLIINILPVNVVTRQCIHGGVGGCPPWWGRQTGCSRVQDRTDNRLPLHLFCHSPIAPPASAVFLVWHLLDISVWGRQYCTVLIGSQLFALYSCTYKKRTHCMYSHFFTIITIIFSCGTTAPSGPGPPHYRGFTITLRHTTHSVGLL